jgi:hypothetical protein
MKRALCLLGALVSIPACEVSVFGSDPIVLAAEGSSGGTREAHACEEPEDSRRAREEGDDGCDARCIIDPEALAAGTIPATCERVLPGARPGLYTLDMSAHDGVIVEVEICDPHGTAFQISDSATGAPGGGDSGTSSHDADVLLDGTSLHLRASTTATVPPSLVEGYVAAEGCTTRRLVVSEQLLWLVDAERGLCGSGMFRNAPPVDDEGTPDAQWHLAANASVDGTATGSGLRSVELCFW